MSSKKQKTSKDQVSDESIEETNDNIEVKTDILTEKNDPRDEKIADLESQLSDAKNRERDSVLRLKADMENLRRRTEQNIEKVHKFALEKFINELLPVIDSLDQALKISNIENANLASIVKGVELTFKSLIDVISKFGVEIISNINVPLNPNIHQAIAIAESEDISPGYVLEIMQKGYILNGRTIRAAMVVVAKKKE